MDITQAVQTASDFLDEYLFEQRGFSPTEDLADFRLELEETYKGDDGSLVIVFAMRPDEDPDDPPTEVIALAKQCCDALVVAHPDLDALTITFEFVS